MNLQQESNLSFHLEKGISRACQLKLRRLVWYSWGGGEGSWEREGKVVQEVMLVEMVSGKEGLELA